MTCSEAARAADNRGLPAGALLSTARGTAETQMEALSPPAAISTTGEKSRRAPAYRSSPLVLSGPRSSRPG